MGGGSDVPNDYEIIASPEFVDVWSAVTVVGIQDGVRTTSLFTNNTLGEPFFNGGEVSLDNVTYFEYTSENNQCDMDLSQVEITSCGQTCVQVSVPYRSDVSWVRGTNTFVSDGQGNFYHSAPNEMQQKGVTDVRINKIFVNIYPTEI